MRLVIHPSLKRLLVLWSRVTLRGAAAFVAIVGNSGGIIRELIRRQLHVYGAAQMIRRAHPDVVVVMEDNVEGLTGAVTYAARVAGIPFVVLPDYIPNPVEPANYYWETKTHQVRTLLDWLVSRARPKWLYLHKGREMIRLPSATIFAYHLLGCDPPAPWILNSGYAAAIALDSPAMHAHYRRLGFHEAKLRVIGTAQDDKLHERFVHREAGRADLAATLGRAPDRPLILCALPPDQYATGDASSFEYGSYPELIRAWFEELAAVSTRASVVVRPHPRIRPGYLEAMAPDGVHVFWTPTEELIPVCDLYVASVSTTIRWALGLGIPVLNYDCYRYAYDDFSSAKGVAECSERSQFARLLDQLLTRPADLAAKSQADKANWGQVDGRYSRRLLALLRDAAESNGSFVPTHDIQGSNGSKLILDALGGLRPVR